MSSSISPAPGADVKPEAYGYGGLNTFDRLGVWLRTRAVRAHVRSARPQTVLDVGCGYDAGLLRVLLPTVGHAIGIDLEVSDAAKALPNATFHEGWIDEELAALPAESCDLVTLLSVLEHLEDAQAALAGIHRVLVPGATAIVHVPTWIGKRVLEPLAWHLGNSPDSIDDHKMYYGIPDLWPLFVRAGFRPRDLRMRYHTAGFSLIAVARRAK